MSSKPKDHTKTIATMKAMIGDLKKSVGKITKEKETADPEKEQEVSPEEHKAALDHFASQYKLAKLNKDDSAAADHARAYHDYAQKLSNTYHKKLKEDMDSFKDLEEVSDQTLKNYTKGAMQDTISGKKDRNAGMKRAFSRLAGVNKPIMKEGRMKDTSPDNDLPDDEPVTRTLKAGINREKATQKLTNLIDKSKAMQRQRIANSNKAQGVAVKEETVLGEAKQLKNMSDDELKQQHDEVNKKITAKGGVSVGHPLAQKLRTLRGAIAFRKAGVGVKEESELGDLAHAKTLKHRFLVTFSDPKHTMVSKRKEKVQKHVLVPSSKDGQSVYKGEAGDLVHKYMKKQGYKVHDVEHVGMVEKKVNEAAGHKPGWMLKADPALGKKIKDKVNLAKKRQASYGNPDAGKSVKEEVEQVDELKDTTLQSYQAKRGNPEARKKTALDSISKFFSDKRNAPGKPDKHQIHTAGLNRARAKLEKSRIKQTAMNPQKPRPAPKQPTGYRSGAIDDTYGT